MRVGIINKLAHKRYQEFVSAMDGVAMAIEDCDRHIARVDKNKAAMTWTASTQTELKAFRKQAAEALVSLRKIAKNHEADLISREWRV